MFPFMLIDIDMDWEFFEGTIADLSDNEIDDIQYFKTEIIIEN